MIYELFFKLYFACLHINNIISSLFNLLRFSKIYRVKMSDQFDFSQFLSLL